MMSAPMAGTAITSGPSVCPSGVTSAVLKRWKKNRLVKNPISRRSPSATYALTIPMTTANTLMGMSRGVTVKSPRLSAMSRSGLAIRAGSPLTNIIEEHAWLVLDGVHAADDLMQERRELPPGAGGQIVNRADQAVLDGARRLDADATAPRCQHQLEPACVAGGAPPRDEAALDQPRDYGRHGALMGAGAFRELVQRLRGRFGELLEHEELRAADSELLFRAPGRFAQDLYDPPQRIEDVA